MTEVGNVMTYYYSGATDGIPWTVESTFLRSSNTISMSLGAWTRWSTKAAALHQGVIVLWPTKGHKFPEGTVFKLPAITIDSTMRQLVGQEAGEAVDAQALLDASPVEVHNEAIDKNFYVLTSGAANPAALLNEPAETALIEYAEWMSSKEGRRSTGAVLRLIVAWDRGLTLLTEGTVRSDEAIIERIVKLGAELSKTLAAQPT